MTPPKAFVSIAVVMEVALSPRPALSSELPEEEALVHIDLGSVTAGAGHRSRW